jgi:hypothetical protein
LPSSRAYREQYQPAIMTERVMIAGIHVALWQDFML